MPHFCCLRVWLGPHLPRDVDQGVHAPRREIHHAHAVVEGVRDEQGARQECEGVRATKARMAERLAISGLVPGALIMMR